VNFADRASIAAAAIQRIDDWLRRHAPAVRGSLCPPAADADVAVVEDLTNRQLPTDLLVWWRYADGAASQALHTAGALIPRGFVPLSIEHALGRRHMHLDVALSIAPMPRPAWAAFIAGQNALPAGTACQAWLPSWLPIANNGAGMDLFVDLRDGNRHGCITSFAADGGSASAPEWADVAAMLFDIAERLEDGEPEFTDDAIISGRLRARAAEGGAVDQQLVSQFQRGELKRSIFEPPDGVDVVIEVDTSDDRDPVY
jgi:cell wall assembly regulator SMI1